MTRKNPVLGPKVLSVQSPVKVLHGYAVVSYGGDIVLGSFDVLRKEVRRRYTDAVWTALDMEGYRIIPVTIGPRS
ncbi:MAG: hypothetical protein JWM16_6383 [Verrucomicrobiales bacterium]|nr:hypothetical protein [Verrucomicrobiales bacterium]